MYTYRPFNNSQTVHISLSTCQNTLSSLLFYQIYEHLVHISTHTSQTIHHSDELRIEDRLVLKQQTLNSIRHSWVFEQQICLSLSDIIVVETQYEASHSHCLSVNKIIVNRTVAIFGSNHDMELPSP